MPPYIFYGHDGGSSGRIECRLTALGALLLRDNLSYVGWTEQEADGLQDHIGHVFLPIMRKFLEQLHDSSEALTQARVLKTHLVVSHATEKMMTHGGLQVRTQNHVPALQSTTISTLACYTAAAEPQQPWQGRGDFRHNTPQRQSG